MGLSRYSIKLFIFLVLLSLNGFAIFWALYSSQLIITNVVIISLFITQFGILLRYLNKTNKDLEQFLSAIQYLDNVPGEKTDLSHHRLHTTYNKIIGQLRDAWLAKESDHQYFKFVLEHIGIGILSSIYAALFHSFFDYSLRIPSNSFVFTKTAPCPLARSHSWIFFILRGIILIRPRMIIDMPIPILVNSFQTFSSMTG